MSGDVCTSVAEQMFVALFQEIGERYYPAVLQEVQSLIKATLDLEELPTNTSTIRFAHTLHCLEGLAIVAKRDVLEKLRARIQVSLDGVTTYA